MLAGAGGQFGWLAAAPATGVGGDLLSSGFIAVGVMLLVWLLLRMQWRRQRARHDALTPLEHMEQISTAARQREREDLAAADLVQLSRRVLAQIEARSAHLEALIADADDRIEQLRRLEGGHTRSAAPARSGDGADRRESDEISARAGRNGHAAGTDAVTRGVYDLADRGLAPVEIARELDQHLGAVELILALRPK